MNLENAIQAHAEWIIKLRMAISKKEPLDVKVLSADNQCQLGKWLHREGKLQYGKLASFSECVKAHATFHTEVGQVARAIEAKDYDGAKAMLDAGTPFTKASTTVGIAIGRLKKEAKL